ncbi:hypothetical protein [Roseibium sp. SCP14]|uniref:hypothetical protein n=1 Tax=Roseibium sp. SCP14 TaxID=3141375 RepID=UPI00333737E1
MKTGSSFWRADMMAKNLISAALLSVLVGLASVQTEAADSETVTWSDRITTEKANGDLVDVPPFVRIGNLPLSRFAQMQSLDLHDTLKIDSGDGTETLFVFRAWQGGASQGEQLMIVSLSPAGLDVLGPYPEDFETVKVRGATPETGPVFELYRADPSIPFRSLEYLNGQLLRLN